MLCIVVCASLLARMTEAAEPVAYWYAADPCAQIVAMEYSPAAITQKLRVLTRPAAPETLAAVAQCSLHLSAAVRLESVHALARLGTELEVRRPLIAALADIDPAVQREAVKALGLLKSNVALPQLRAIAGMTKDDDLHRESLLAISAITGE